ncbi:hypothetical protein MAR_010867 [Mya arenaria]|uniref:Uncharacterized protein n=1 Tax=Mya arenaria TaxID=6604 RepID=A0ABY7FWC2_MYAAR|nr:hypothetical protein MAR_010867 [Mya arenaria]
MDVFLAFLVAICDVRYGMFDWVTGLLFTNGMAVIVEKNSSRANPLEFNLDMRTGTFSQLDLLSAEESSSALTEAFLTIKSALSSSVPWEMARVILVAMPQFLRKPTWLKAKLQGLRSKLGPMYVLFVASYFFSRWGSYDNMLADMFALFVAMVALIAGTVFRPDNATVFDLFGVRSTLSKRRFLHGQCMIVTLVLCCVMYYD